MIDKEAIIELYRQENQAMVDKDIVKLNEILAPSMELRHMTGYQQPKLEWIDQIQNGEMKYFSSVEENIEDVKIDGNSASLVGQNKVKASVWGSGVATWSLQMKMEFTKNNGKWIIANQYASMY
ncbi:nuclear transport factor 2 family protein [Limosilactobacillus pontis]|uniref:nuclear transport factor 2 family protein n=1 Tax=Limosilactobacillus pontis TaxID=35787 RepID=UPI0025A3F2F9|nr:nuclear transport factor 2 family protein [Limosilactobacillus pontis]MDM8332389.1 nuclear transport factor 2 family protein [Limosilactobacillus pontis]